MSQNIVVQNNVMKDVDVKQLAKAVAAQLESDFEPKKSCNEHQPLGSMECTPCAIVEFVDRRIAAALKAALGSGSDD